MYKKKEKLRRAKQFYFFSPYTYKVLFFGARYHAVFVVVVVVVVVVFIVAVVAVSLLLFLLLLLLLL